MEKLTISDIAKLANVSIATVSNYLNGNFKKMSPKTRQKVEQIINQTNYRPNGTARSLAKNQNMTIGVSIADITNPFTSSVMSGIYEVCDQFGYKVLFTNADNNQENETNNILRLRSENVAGFIIDPVNVNNSLYKTFSNQSTVIVDRQSNHPEIDTIVTDNTHAVFTMTKRMMAKNYAELYFVTWPLEGISTRTLRYQGFLDATGYQSGTHIITVPHHGEQAEYESFNDQIRKTMLDNRGKKVGFFAMNARVFIRLIKAMQMAGYSYPVDYGVATYEEFDWMQLMRPGISCIQQDSHALGIAAAQLLKNKLSGNVPEKPQIKLIPTKLVMNESF